MIDKILNKRHRIGQSSVTICELSRLPSLLVNLYRERTVRHLVEHERCRFVAN